MAHRDDRGRAVRAHPPSSPTRQARPAGRLGGVGRPADGQGDLRLDGPGADRLLPAQAERLAGRAVSPCHLELPARMDGGSTDCPAHGPSHRRGLDGESTRAEEHSAALRDPACLPSERVEGGAQRTRQGGAQGAASTHHPSRRSGPHRPHGRRDRRRNRRVDRHRGARFRPGRRRRRTGWPCGSGLWRVRRPGHLGGRRGRDRWTGHVEFADPQLPRVPAWRQWAAARSAGLRAGLGLRGQLHLHARGDRPKPRP